VSGGPRRLGALLPAWAARRPGALALVDGGRRWTAAALDARVGRAAGGLAAAGLRPGDRLGIGLPRSADAVIALHAALRAGLVAVPLDPTAPPAWTEDLLRRTGAVAALLPPGRRGPGVPVLGPGALDGPAMAPARGGGARDAALILATSGSTGRPKGVTLSHAAVLAFARWAARRVGLGPLDRVAHLSPLSFDLATFELFGSAVAGAAAVVGGPALAAAPAALAAFVDEQQISALYGVPSVLAPLAAAPRPRALRALIFAGEPFPPAALGALMRAWPGVGVHNFFGPTECNVCAAHTLGGPPDGPAPIGGPASGARLRVVGPGGRPAPDGELWVSGPSVMTGYWGDPGATARALTRRGGRLWLRTGDRVRRGPRGLEFLGRLDRQLKVGGHRVQPEALEAVLEALPGVRAALARREGGALVVDVELDGEAQGEPDLGPLRRALRAALPAGAQPAALRRVEALPRTDRGKRDRG